MIKTFLNSIERAKNQVNDSIFMFTHRKKNTYFTRNTAKMEFSDAICFILKGIKRTLQIELDNWFEFLDSGKTMTKQAFSQLRQKIKPEAFVHLNDDFITWFYDDDNFKKFRGYRLLAIDGSITEIPNTVCTREYFGYHHNQSQRKNARAMFSVIYDIENDYILESDIRTWKTGEREIAKELIIKLENKGFKNDLFLFDRGYPSREMFSFLESKKVKFLMRVKTNKFSTEIDNANEADQIIVVKDKKNELRLRIINIILPSGETEKLVTNLVEEDYTNEDFKQLYFKRWSIEVRYNQLKSRYELENFSGNTPIAIEQDFYATIYLSNLMAMAKNEANEESLSNDKNLKYDYKVNMNILIPKMTKVLIKCFYAENLERRNKLFDKAMSNITKNLVPIRPGRNFPRREPSRKNKYPLNKKRF